jgi:hypothetical protein
MLGVPARGDGVVVYVTTHNIFTYLVIFLRREILYIIIFAAAGGFNCVG